MKGNVDMGMSSDKTIIGIHIPKTAGTSLRKSLARIFPDREIAYLYRHSPGTIRSQLIGNLIDLKSRRAKLPKIIYGHMGFGLHKITGIDALYVTILRDPLKRALSLYRHERRNKEALFHKEANRYGVKEFFSQELSPQFKNSMTTMIAGILWQEVYWYLEGDDTHALEIAKENLKKYFLHVGFTENIEHTQKVLSKYFGKGIDIGSDNRDPEPFEISELDSETVGIIQEKFGMDMKLYEFARSLFGQKEENDSSETSSDKKVVFLSDKVEVERNKQYKSCNHEICLVTCFLLTDEMCRVLDDFSLELSKRGYDLIVLSASVPKGKSTFHIIEVPYSLYDYGQAYDVKIDHYDRISPEIREIVLRDISFQGEIAKDFYDHLKGYFVCEHIFSAIIKTLKPRCVFVWGATLPQSTVQKNICERTGVPVFILERGLLADTLMVEQKGNGAESELNMRQDWWRKWQVSEDVSCLLKAREYYLLKKPQKYSHIDYDESVRILNSLELENKKILVFWGQHDVWSGLVPRESSLSVLNSPFFESTADALEGLVEAVRNISNAILIFKPHPRDTRDYSDYQDDDVIVIRDIDNHALFQYADSFAAMLTTTQFEALFYEKPVILLAASQMQGKGVAYEFSAQSSLSNIIEAAITKKDFETKRENIKKFLSGLLCDFLYGCSDDIPTGKHLADLALIPTLHGIKDNETSSVNERISELSVKLRKLSCKCDDASYSGKEKSKQSGFVEEGAKKKNACFSAAHKRDAEQRLVLPEDVLPTFDRFFKSLITDNISRATLMQTGILCYRLNLYTESKECFNKILSSDPENIDALNNLGAVCFQLKEYNTAYDVLKRATELASDNQEAKQNLLALQQRMQEEWDERAAEDARYYIHSAKRNQTEEEFDLSGRNNVQTLILNDLKNIAGTKNIRSMKVLEIGCGIGRMTKHMADIFGEVHGIDVSGEMIRRGRERLRSCSNIFLHKGNGKDLSVFDDLTFDFVFSFIVFQHIPFKEVILNYIREVNRVLKPDGIFKFQVHGEVGHNYLKSPKNTWHGEPITEGDVRNISEEVGFELLSMSGQGTQYSWYTLKKTMTREKIRDSEGNDGKIMRKAQLSSAKTSDGVERLLDEITRELERYTRQKGVRL